MHSQATNGNTVMVPENHLRYSVLNLSNACLLNLKDVNLESGIVLEGRVIDINEGTEELIIAVTKDLIVYMPISEISFRREMTMSEVISGRYIGKHLQMIVTSVDEQKICASRKILQQKVICNLKSILNDGVLKFKGVVRNLYQDLCFAEIAAGITDIVGATAKVQLPNYAELNSVIDLMIVDIVESETTNLKILEDLGTMKIERINPRKIVRYDAARKVLTVIAGIGTMIDIYGVTSDVAAQLEDGTAAHVWIVQGQEPFGVLLDPAKELEIFEKFENDSISEEELNTQLEALVISTMKNLLADISVNSIVKSRKFEIINSSRNPIIESRIVETLIRCPAITVASLYEKLKFKRMGSAAAGIAAESNVYTWKEFKTSLNSLMRSDHIRIYRSDLANLYLTVLGGNGYSENYDFRHDIGGVVVLTNECYAAYQEEIGFQITTDEIKRMLESDIKVRSSKSSGISSNIDAFYNNVKKNKKFISYLRKSVKSFDNFIGMKKGCKFSKREFVLYNDGMERIAILEYLASNLKVPGYSNDSRRRQYKYNVLTSNREIPREKSAICIFAELQNDSTHEKEIVCFALNGRNYTKRIEETLKLLKFRNCTNVVQVRPTDIFISTVSEIEEDESRSREGIIRVKEDTSKLILNSALHDDSSWANERVMS